MRSTYRLKVEYLNGPLVIPGIGRVQRALEGIEPQFRTVHSAEKEAKRMVSRSRTVVKVIQSRTNAVIATYGFLREHEALSA